MKISILKVLLQMDGTPMPESSLISAVQMLCFPRPTEGDVRNALRDVEASGYCAGATDDLSGVSWTLTEKGTHKARQIR